MVLLLMVCAIRVNGYFLMHMVAMLGICHGHENDSVTMVPKETTCSDLAPETEGFDLKGALPCWHCMRRLV